jgi:hypothetical protein
MAEDEIGGLTADLHPITGGWGVNTFWTVGTSGGLARTSASVGGANIGGEAYFGNNKWVATLAWLPAQLVVATRAGAVLTAYNQGGVSVLHCMRPGTDSPVVWAGGGASNKYGIADGSDLADLSKTPYGISGVFRHTIGADPTGQYVLLSEAASLHKSSDYGASWGLIPDFAYPNSIWSLGDRDHWIIQGGLAIHYTSDFGTTWIVKTGDLQSQLQIDWYAIAVRTWY